jgi:hypothetical protein
MQYAIHERNSTLFKTVVKNYLKKEFVDNCPVIFNINIMEETAILLLTINLPRCEIIQFKNNCL